MFRKLRAQTRGTIGRDKRLYYRDHIQKYLQEDTKAVEIEHFVTNNLLLMKKYTKQNKKIAQLLDQDEEIKL